MSPSSHPPASGSAGRRAVLGYIAAWVVTGAIVALGIVAVLRGGDDEVALPPVRQTELSQAAREAGCQLRAGAAARGDEPPIAGPPARAAAAGVYENAPSARALVGALRRGLVVISYRPDLPEERRDQLETVQRAVPEGTIVVRDDRMRFVVAVSAWQRLLGCPRAGPKTLDALRLFSGRFLGSGPDSPR